MFELPKLYLDLQAQAHAQFQHRNYAEAEQLVRRMVALVPYDSGCQYNLACVLAREGKADEALRALEKAMDLGFRDLKHIEQDENLAALRSREDFSRVLARALTARADPRATWKPPVEPAVVDDGVARVTEANTWWDPRFGIFRSVFKFADRPSGSIATGFGEAGELLRRWDAEQTAAGNHGDLYDNHDGGHAAMDYGTFGQLSRIEFGEEVKRLHLDYGLQSHFIYAAPTLGNSSTAVTGGAMWRSLPRYAFILPHGRSSSTSSTRAMSSTSIPSIAITSRATTAPTAGGTATCSRQTPLT